MIKGIGITGQLPILQVLTRIESHFAALYRFLSSLVDYRALFVSHYDPMPARSVPEQTGIAALVRDQRAVILQVCIGAAVVGRISKRLAGTTRNT